MESNDSIRLPAHSLVTLRHALAREAGTEAARRALQEAGHAVGDSLFDELDGGGPLADIPADAFWSRLDRLARSLGWGSLEHQEVHPGVGALMARDWFEVDEDASRPTAPFTAGVLANVLGRAADGEVAVLQVPCDEGGRCIRFLFGAPGVLDRVYTGIREGADVDGSVAALG